METLAIVRKVIGERRGAQWRNLFNHTRQVKFLPVSWQVALDVAHSFQQDGQLDMKLLPALELVIIGMTEWHALPLGPNSQDHATIRDAFEPLVAARKKAGRLMLLLRGVLFGGILERIYLGNIEIVHAHTNVSIHCSEDNTGQS